jgi:hypothetical protein
MATLAGTGLAQQGGVGVSPPHVDFGEVGPPSQATDSLTIKSDWATDTVFDIAVSGEDASWFSVAARGDERVLSYVISDIQPAGDDLIEASFRSDEVELGSLNSEVSVRELATRTPTLTDSSTTTDSSGASPWRVSGIAIAVGIVSVGGAFVMARMRTWQQTGVGWRRRRNEAPGRHSAEGGEPGWSGDRAEGAGGS